MNKIIPWVVGGAAVVVLVIVVGVNILSKTQNPPFAVTKTSTANEVVVDPLAATTTSQTVTRTYEDNFVSFQYPADWQVTHGKEESVDNSKHNKLVLNVKSPSHTEFRDHILIRIYSPEQYTSSSSWGLLPDPHSTLSPEIQKSLIQGRQSMYAQFLEKFNKDWKEQNIESLFCDDIKKTAQGLTRYGLTTFGGKDACVVLAGHDNKYLFGIINLLSGGNIVHINFSVADRGNVNIPEISKVGPGFLSLLGQRPYVEILSSLHIK